MRGKLAGLETLGATHHHQRVAVVYGILQNFSGYVRMYSELSGPLHKLLQVGKFDGRKGKEKKLARNTEAEEAFETRKRTLLGKLRLFLINLDKGFVLRTDASDYDWEQSWSKSERMVTMSQWLFRVEFWQRGNAALGLRGKRRHMPLSAPCASGPDILVCNPLSCAPTINLCRLGTRSTSTPPRVRQPDAPDGTGR